LREREETTSVFRKKRGDHDPSPRTGNLNRKPGGGHSAGVIFHTGGNGKGECGVQAQRKVLKKKMDERLLYHVGVLKPGFEEEKKGEKRRAVKKGTGGRDRSKGGPFPSVNREKTASAEKEGMMKGRGGKNNPLQEKKPGEVPFGGVTLGATQTKILGPGGKKGGGEKSVLGLIVGKKKKGRWHPGKMRGAE